MKLAIWGANGKMGSELIKAADCDVLACTRTNPCIEQMLLCDVIIDFSAPAASNELLEILLKEQSKRKVPALLVGTTGLSEAYFKRCKELKAPYFWASNTSVGIAVLTELCRQASKLLDGFDIEISETHHRFKKDAPSGTALSLAKEIASVNGKKLAINREGERAEDEIGLSAIRGGDIAGRHIVGFYGDGEWLELQHFANSRSIFAKGAIKIAKWLISQPIAQYGMKDYIKTIL